MSWVIAELGRSFEDREEVKPPLLVIPAALRAADVMTDVDMGLEPLGDPPAGRGEPFGVFGAEAAAAATDEMLGIPDGCETDFVIGRLGTVRGSAVGGVLVAAGLIEGRTGPPEVDKR